MADAGDVSAILGFGAGDRTTQARGGEGAGARASKGATETEGDGAGATTGTGAALTEAVSGQLSSLSETPCLSEALGKAPGRKRRGKLRDYALARTVTRPPLPICTR